MSPHSHGSHDGGMAVNYDENEKYLPGLIYPEDGVTAIVTNPDEQKIIDKHLNGDFSRFGEYRVVEYLGRTITRKGRKDQIKWRIQCSCGWEREISHDNLSCLRNGTIKRGTVNCRSPQHDTRLMIGCKYDRLTIVGHTKGKWLNTIPKGQTPGTWLLVMACDCGKYTRENPYIAPPSYILAPLAKGQELFGCGCRNSSQDGLSKTKPHERWEGAKSRAKKFGLDFNIDVEDCVAPEYCPALGIKLISTNSGPSDNSPTLDRINPSKGYVKGNVAVISNRANRIKNDATVEEMRRVAEWFEKVSSTNNEEPSFQLPQQGGSCL